MTIAAPDWFIQEGKLWIREGAITLPEYIEGTAKGTVLHRYGAYYKPKGFVEGLGDWLDYIAKSKG